MNPPRLSRKPWPGRVQLLFQTLFWTAAAIIFIDHALARDRLVLNMAFEPGYVQAVFQMELAREAFRRIGLKVEFVHVPAERALLNVHRGIDDGNLIRVAGLEQFYPNIIRVPEKFIDYQFCVFTRHSNLTIEDWDSLAPYHVGIVTGWKILETHITTTKSLIKVRDDRQLFAMLQHDRVDLIIYERWQGLQLMREFGLNEVKIVEPPLARKEMFMYLNRKHRHLVPRLTSALRQIKEDGTYQHIVDKTFSSLF